MSDASKLKALQGHRLKFFRGKLGMDQKDLAKAIGITPGAVSLAESGKNFLSYTHMTKAAKVLGVPVSVLLTELELADEDLEMIVGLYKIAGRRNKSKNIDAIRTLVKSDLSNLD